MTTIFHSLLAATGLLAETEPSGLDNNLAQIVEKIKALMDSFWIYSATRF